MALHRGHHAVHLHRLLARFRGGSLSSPATCRSRMQGLAGLLLQHRLTWARLLVLAALGPAASRAGGADLSCSIRCSCSPFVPFLMASGRALKEEHCSPPRARSPSGSRRTVQNIATVIGYRERATSLWTRPSAIDQRRLAVGTPPRPARFPCSGVTVALRPNAQGGAGRRRRPGRLPVEVAEFSVSHQARSVHPLDRLGAGSQVVALGLTSPPWSSPAIV